MLLHDNLSGIGNLTVKTSALYHFLLLLLARQLINVIGLFASKLLSSAESDFAQSNASPPLRYSLLMLPNPPASGNRVSSRELEDPVAPCMCTHGI